MRPNRDKRREEMDPYIGEIRVFGFEYFTEDWLPCDGRELLISQEQDLFSVIGTIYGGKANTHFNLPHLSYRAPVGAGTGIGLKPRKLADKFGQEVVKLTYENFAPHTHDVSGKIRANAQNRSNEPGSDYYMSSPTGINLYSKIEADSKPGEMNRQTISDAGYDESSRCNVQPYVALNFCIARRGIFPKKA